MIDQPKLAILGAGITGISTAYFCHQLLPQAQIEVFEASDTLGGRIQTKSTPSGLLELGPQSFLARGESGTLSLNFFEQLGLKDHLMPRRKDAAMYVLLDRKLIGISPLSMIRHFPGILLEIFRSKGPEEESVSAFIRRRFGNYFHDHFASAIINSMRGHAIEALTTDSYPWSLLKSLEQQYGSTLLSLPAYMSKLAHTHAQGERALTAVSFTGGLTSLPQIIAEQLEGQVKFHLQKPIHFIQSSEGKVELTFNSSKSYFNRVISCLPAPRLQSILPDGIPRTLLSQIKASNIILVSLAYDHSVGPTKGWGYIIPDSESSPVLGVQFLSTMFDWPAHSPNSQHKVFTVFLGGWQELSHPIYSLDEDEWVRIAQQTLRKHLGITATPLETHTQLHSQAIPIYEVGHKKRIEKIRHSLQQQIPGLTLAGQSFDGVSLADCIASAHNATYACASSITRVSTDSLREAIAFTGRRTDFR